MSLRQFEYLMAVVEEGSFTLAARRLDVSQPALSPQVRALERSVGQPLLERAATGVHLTPMGRAFVPHAESALRRAERARRSLRPAVDELRIATLYSIAIGILPPAIRAWRSRHPGGRVEVLEYANIDELAEQMRLGVADVGIGPRPVRWDGPVRVLGEEDLVVVLDEWPTAHVELRALADRPWVLYAYDNSLTPVVEQACADAGFAPRAAGRPHPTANAGRRPGGAHPPHGDRGAARGGRSRPRAGAREHDRRGVRRRRRVARSAGAPRAVRVRPGGGRRAGGRARAS